MTSGAKRKFKSFNDLLFFFASMTFTVSLLISFLSMKNDCIYLENEIHHLQIVRENHLGRVKILSSDMKKLSRQDRIENFAREHFNLHAPSPESLIVLLQD